MPTPEQVRSAIDRYAAAVATASKATVMECYADNATVQDPYPQPPHVGKEAVGAFWDGVLGMSKPVAFEARDVVVVSDRGAFVFAIQVEIGEGDGKVRLEVVGYEIMTVDDDGLICDQLAYWDPASMHPVP